MIESIKNLYHAEDLTGEAFLRPLKRFHGFSVKEISACKGIKELARTITCVVAGIFAYPLFGLLALIGMGIKCIHIPEMRQHNQKQKEQVNNVCTIVSNSFNVSVELKDSSLEKGYKEIPITDSSLIYRLNSHTTGIVRSTFLKEIDQCTAKYMKVYISFEEIDEYLGSKVGIRLVIRQHI